MRQVRVWATWAGVAVLLSASLSHAQCTKDVDCKGERICQDGNCVAPPPGAAAPPPAASSETTPAPPAAPGAAPATAPLPPAAASYQAPVAGDVPAGAVQEPRYERRSAGMFAGGIVMVSIGALALGVAVISSGTSRCDTDSSFGGQSCDRSPNYTAFLISAGLLGAGIPMIIIGGKRVPVEPQTGLSPWVSPQGGGLRLQLTL